jgi:DNA-binding NtrC family response regulator/tetratricopeptide (TPR) repeat protein
MLGAHRATTALHVGELDSAGVREYLQSPETVARVLARTGGHPQAIDLLLDGDPLTPEGRVWRKLAEMSEGARGLVEALAVVERATDIEVLARVAPRAVGATERNEFGRSDLVASTIVDGALLFGFARESDREHAYDQIDDGRRRRLHARCVDIYAALPGREQDATRHALRAGLLDRAVPLALEAARSLAARHAHGEAAALLEEVAAATGGVVPLEVSSDLADLYRASGDYKRGLAHARLVRDATPASATATRRVGELLTLAGMLDEAAGALESARQLAAASDQPDAVPEVEAQLGELNYQRACYDEARTWAERALEDARARGLVPLQLFARNTLGKLALAQKDASAAAALFELNREVAEKADLPHQVAQALTNLGVAMLRRQDLAGAEDAFSRAIEVARRVGDTRERAIATENLAVLAHLRHDYANAQTQYHEAVALLKRLGNRAMLARVAINLGELYLCLGERARAQTLCEFSAHMGGTGLPPSIRAEILLLRGRIEALEGNTAGARASFEGALGTYERLREATMTEARLELARVALTDGDVATARTILNDIPLQESPKRAAEVALLAVDIERAAGSDTLAASRRAHELALRADDRDVLLRCQIRLARALCDDSDLTRATDVLERAERLEQDLSKSVPEEASAAWSGRETRRELEAVQAQIASAWADGVGPATPRRISSFPPPPKPVARRTSSHDAYPDLVGDSAAMQRVMSLLDRVAPTDALVLIRGESGTGKELVAEALHRNSARHLKPLVKVNCAALVETLLLSELFGHERGAFTGANARKKGRFEMANGGTIFLDEIGDISQKTQVALLRVLQEREFERVGGTQPIKVDVRIIAATHRDLEQMVRDGEFREDLYYRLRGVMVEMPPLRAHPGDLPALCSHLLEVIAKERSEAPKIVSREALDLLGRHAWPGNVRELENVLRSATLFADSPVLSAEDFAAFAETFESASEPQTLEPEPELASGAERGMEDLIYDKVRESGQSLLDLKKDIERECIARALRETDGNITRAASLLGMKRPRLSQLVKQYKLNGAGEA